MNPFPRGPLNNRRTSAVVEATAAIVASSRRLRALEAAAELVARRPDALGPGLRAVAATLAPADAELAALLDALAPR